MIKFLDLQAINNAHGAQIQAAMERVLRSGWYLLGQEVRAFEEQYARYCGAAHCVAVANGLDALSLILRASVETGRLHEGDEVLVPANTYIATILAITQNRLVPVLVEPDMATYNLDPLQIPRAITSRTRAIMAVHLYGLAAPMDVLSDVAKKYGLLLFDDAAQAHGATLNGVRTGAMSLATGFSFYPGKNLGALGDAGAVTTDDPELARAVRTLANYGSSKKYINQYQGVNSRMDELHAAVLQEKLPYLDAENQRRREIAALYCQHIRHPEVNLPSMDKPEHITQDRSHVWHIFAVRTPHRTSLQEHLNTCGIQTLIHYPVPPHKQEAYKAWNHLHLPVTEAIHQQELSLPLSPVLTQEEAFKVVEAVNLWKP